MTVGMRFGGGLCVVGVLVLLVASGYGAVGAAAGASPRGGPLLVAAGPAPSAVAAGFGSGSGVASPTATRPLTVLPAAPALGAAPLTTVSVGAGFPGISDGNSSCGCAPPDVQVAVGTKDVVEMVNLEGKIWTKSGTVVTSFTLASFFVAGTDFISDPKVLYDNVSGRWFASLLDVTTGTIHVAVSATGDPTGSWTVYSVGGSPSGDFPDQPILGIDKTLVTIGGNVFVYSTGSYVYGELWALNKTSMLSGATTYYSAFHNTAWFSMHPAREISAATTEYVVMTSGTSTLDLFKLTGSPSNKTNAHLSAATAFTVTSFSSPPSAPQRATTKKLDTGDARVQDAEWRSNVLWVSFNTGCKPSGDTTTRACVRLVEITTGTTNAIAQDFNLAKARTYLFYAALALDGKLNLGVIYGLANATTYPAVYATGQLHGSHAGTLLAPKLLKAGAGSATVACTGSVCRWGDYYGAGADPKGPSLWMAGEYVAASTSWATWIASLKV
jgi:hypothetical protein